MADEFDPSEDNCEYVLVNSLDVLFNACSWFVPEVRVLKDSQGMPLAFVAISRVNNRLKERRNLPIEFFNHQLVDLDYRNPDKFAEFMSEYGFMGRAFYRAHENKRISEGFVTLDPFDRSSIEAFESLTGYMPGTYPSMHSLDWHDIHTHYYELKASFAEVEERLKLHQTDEATLKKMEIRGILSVNRAQYLFEDWLYCVKHIQAMVQYRTPGELAKALNEDEHGVVRACMGARNILQRHLKDVHPTLDILNVTEGQYLSHSSSERSGSFELALAIQIWNFVLESKSGYTVCKECGKAFVHKQTKSRKSHSRSTSQFCCDRCKNRAAQRRYRKTPGYTSNSKKARKEARAGQD